jgi:ketosteroid isomerase-like protein
MISSDPESVVRAFIDRVNSHDPRAIVALCTSGHVSTDSLGNQIRGRAALLSAWQGYLSLFPDYRIAVSNILAAGSTVAVFGIASATLATARKAPHRSWSIPAAWRAVVKAGLVSRWQVYADNKPVYELLERVSPRP